MSFPGLGCGSAATRPAQMLGHPITWEENARPRLLAGRLGRASRAKGREAALTFQLREVKNTLPSYFIECIPNMVISYHICSFKYYFYPKISPEQIQPKRFKRQLSNQKHHTTDKV